MSAPPSDLAGPAKALLWRAVRRSRRDVVVASLLLTGHQVGEALVPVIIGGVVAQAIAPGGTGRIALWLVLLAGDFLGFSMCYRFGARASVRARQHSGHVVRMWVTERVVAPGGGVELPPGQLLSRASSDAGRVGAFAGTASTTVAAVAVLLVSTVLLLTFSPILAAVILVGTVVLMLVQDRAAGRLRRRSGVEQQQVANATELAEDLVRGLRVLKGIGAERNAAAAYRQASRSALGGALRAVSASSMLSAVSALITGLYLVVIVGVGGWLALSRSLGLGQLVSALGLSQFILGPMQRVAGISAAYARGLASAARIQEILEQPESVVDGVGTRLPPHPDVVFDAVAIDQTHAVSFTATAGRLTGIVTDDPVTAGTIAALLARERDPSAGAIRLDDQTLDQWRLDALRAHLLVAPHDAALFPGTIAANIAARAVDDGARDRGTQAAFADQVIDTLPDGADTEVGDRGEVLSGGQRQRVALARALAADATVLVLHDPTTSVDAATEDGIAARLRALRAGRTTVLITASPALLARCDHVVYVSADGSANGGTHAELAATNPAYAQRIER